MLGKIRRMCPLCWQDSVILVVTMAVVLDLGLLLQPVGAGMTAMQPCFL